MSGGKTNNETSCYIISFAPLTNIVKLVKADMRRQAILILFYLEVIASLPSKLTVRFAML